VGVKSAGILLDTHASFFASFSLNERCLLF